MARFSPFRIGLIPTAFLGCDKCCDGQKDEANQPTTKTSANPQKNDLDNAHERHCHGSFDHENDGIDAVGEQ